ncbi:MAG: hypothetical protein AAF267_01400 [Deinococcota bacterium]
MQTSKLPEVPLGSVTAPRFEDDWTKYSVWVLDNHGAIYREFRRLIDEWLEHNPTEIVSSRMALEVLRWNTSLRASGDAFKINNNILPLLSRLYIHERPHKAVNFKLRKSVYDRWQDYPQIKRAFEVTRKQEG